jgi:hypothetical protein
MNLNCAASVTATWEECVRRWFNSGCHSVCQHATRRTRVRSTHRLLSMTAIVPRLHNATRHIVLSSLRDAPVQHYPVAPLASSTYRSLTPTRKLVVLAPWRVTLPKANSNAKNVRKESRDGIRKYIKRTHTCMVSEQHSRLQEVWPVYITTQCHTAKYF